VAISVRTVLKVETRSGSAPATDNKHNKYQNALDIR
jgi:hypothetical protein